MKGFTRGQSVLEFDKILSIASTFAYTEGGKQAILASVPSPDPVVVTRLLDETEEALELLTYKGAPPLSCGHGIIDAVERSHKGAILTAAELLSVAGLLRTAIAVKQYAAGKEQKALGVYFHALLEERHLANEIDRIIIAEDMIADDASDALLRIRRSIRRAETEVREVLNRIITGPSQKHLQEPIVTQRSGRFVVPVKASEKSAIKGIVHDSSASGATLFIEPAAVVEANNRLRDLMGQEKEEIEKILRDLSGEVSACGTIITVNCRTIITLDVVFARASYSSSVRGSRPSMGGKEICIVRGRHPLIPADTVVPTSLCFGDAEKTLIVTGPNTGGKTVTLKTIGLFAYLAQTGFLLPCDDGTALPVFSGVLADIGDEQSIEQSLSTFSAHMVNIVSILKECDSGCLVLFDELGAGTDPTEGAALAISILERVRSMGALTAATTHYSELKLYALDTPGVLNASCEFDVDTLRPTYRLIIGLPGRSNAFAISSRLGLEASIIHHAKELLADDNIRFEDVISRLEESEQTLEKEKTAALEAKRKAQTTAEETERKSRELLDRADAELDRARQQANRILEAAKAASRQVFEELERLKKQDAKKLEAARIEEARRSMRGMIKDASDRIGDLEDRRDMDEDYVLPRPLKAGDSITLADIGCAATVKSVSGDTVVCIVGRTETRTALSNVRLTETMTKAKAKKQTGRTSYTQNAAATKNECDVRGLTGDDAWFVIDRWLEEVRMAGFTAVTVIHGKGTGALRSALWQFFRKDHRIASFRMGRYGEGETGVTILEMKK